MIFGLSLVALALAFWWVFHPRPHVCQWKVIDMARHGWVYTAQASCECGERGEIARQNARSRWFWSLDGKSWEPCPDALNSAAWRTFEAVELQRVLDSQRTVR